MFFLACEETSEVLFGGAAGGGKSDALLMAALQHADVPGYAAILFRRTYADLALPGALMDRAAQWLGGTAATWSGDRKTWTFPSGATLTFGYLETEQDQYRYQSSEFQYLGWDELTQWPTSRPYTYLFSRRRRLAGASVPLRTRAGTNPGGRGHEWVRQRFLVEGASKGRLFVPSKLDDNPHVDRVAYLEGMRELDPVTRAQLVGGDWSARTAGGLFRREWFRIVDVAPADAQRVRRWDLAATEPGPRTDPDWTAGALVAETGGRYTVCDVRRLRARPHAVEALIRQTAETDGRDVQVWIEQEPGSSGKALVDHYQRNVLRGWAVYGDRVTGDKVTRARPVSAAAEAGNVGLLRGPWITDLLDELEAFPGGAHDDQVDALSGAVAALSDGVLPDSMASLRSTDGQTHPGDGPTEGSRIYSGEG